MKRPTLSERKKYDEAAKTIAELFKVHASYVRKVMADKTGKIYKGENPMAIKRAYLQYVNGKQALLKKIAPLAKAA